MDSQFDADAFRRPPSRYQLWLRDVVYYRGILVTRNTAMQLSLNEHGDWEATTSITALPPEDVRVIEDDLDPAYADNYVFSCQEAFDLLSSAPGTINLAFHDARATNPGRDV